MVQIQPPYPPVGRCIYGADHKAGPKGFTKEHIIPLSLGGTLILPEASCDDCRDQTHAFEGQCAGRTFEIARTHFHWASRHRDRPTSLEIGWPTDPRQIPTEEHPPAIALPIFKPPGALTGSSIGEETVAGKMACIGISTYVAPEARERWDRLVGSKELSTPFEIGCLSRTLAKIAHAFACAELGADGFRPFLNEMILGRDCRYAHFVGNPALSTPPEPDLHSLHLWRRGHLVAVTVRLYARLGLMPYLVVVGET